jgi:hypothetical protein
MTAPTLRLPGCTPLPASVASASGLDLDAIRPAPLRILPLSTTHLDCELCGAPTASSILDGWTFGDDGVCACVDCTDGASLAYEDAGGARVPLALTHPALAIALEASLRPRLAALLASALEHAGMVVRERARDASALVVEGRTVGT